MCQQHRDNAKGHIPESHVLLKVGGCSARSFPRLHLQAVASQLSNTTLWLQAPCQKPLAGTPTGIHTPKSWSTAAKPCGRFNSTALQIAKLCVLHSPLSLLSSTRMTSFRSWEGVWLTTLCTERRMTESASLTKMKTTEIWGRSSEYVICLHLWEACWLPGVQREAGTATATVGGQPGRF